MGAFDDLVPAKPAGAFADLMPPKASSPPPLLARRERPSKLKRAAVNAEAAFFGADGDSAGLASEAIIDVASGADRKRSARGNRGLAQAARAVGLDGVAGYLERTADEQDAEASGKAAGFERSQRRRRQAVADLGPAESFGEKAADLGGRVSASLPQPENFVGGPALKGLSLTGKVVRAGTAAAVANLATEPVLQGSAKARGTRAELSAKDAAINTGVAALTGGVFGGAAHGVEKLRGRKVPGDPGQDNTPGTATRELPPEQPSQVVTAANRAGNATPRPAGAFDDLVPPRAAGAFDDLLPAKAQTATVGTRSADGSLRTAVLRQQRPHVARPGEPLAEGMTRTAVRRDATVRVGGRPSRGPAPVAAPAFQPNSMPPVPPSDGGGVFGELRDLYAGSTVDQALGDAVKPEDVVPLRGPRSRVGDNRVSSLAEAERANPSTVEPVAIPDERDVFQTRRLASRNDPTRGQYRREPLDLVSQVRRWGGLRDSGGELAYAGIDNDPRNVDFARDEQFLGRLVDNENGLGLDEAAQRAWEEGWFPDLNERPDVETFLSALSSTHRGENRLFHPDDARQVADYYATRGDRERLQQAVTEGAPLATVRGAPVGPDDLPTPPVEAYRADLPAAKELAGNIRTDLLDSPQSIHRALKDIATKAGGFEEARRGIQTQDQTRTLAAEMGMAVEQLLKRRPGMALNAEQALAARQLLAKSGNELVALAKRTKGGSDEDLAAFRSALLKHAAIQEQVAGMTAEAGRTLSQFRMTANSRDAIRGPVIRGDVVRSIVDSAGGRDHLEDVAEKLLEQGGDPAKLNKLALAAAKPGGREKFMEVYINSLLSGPQTHAVNILSNAITAIGQVPETLGAAAFGAMRRGDRDRVLFSEVGARAVGLIQGAREGLRLAKTTFRTGEPSDMVGAIENSQYRAISGRKGELIRVPTRALTAEDEFFKAIARRMELNALAVRKAAASGLKGQARRDRVAELVANPTDEMFEQAKEYARYLTFQRKLGTMGQRALAFTNTPTAGGAVVKWLFPFLRTPINLMKFAVERSPMAPALKEWRADWKAGGALRDAANARFVVGSGVTAMVAAWAADGTITGGGPSDPEERALLMADGWRPYSVRIGNTFYSYERLDPLAKVLGTVADVVEHSEHASDRDAAEVGGAVVGSVVANLAGPLFLDTMSDLAGAVDQPKAYGQQFLASQAGKLVPAAVGQVAQADDPIMREAKAPLDRIKSRVPGLSSGLLPKRDIWGEPVERPGRLGPDIGSPLPVGKSKNDLATRELMRLGVQVGRLQRKIGDAELTAVEYDAYQHAAGRLSKRYVLDEMRSRDWRSLPDADKAEAIKAAIRDARKDARDQMHEQFPNLQTADE